MRRRTIIAVLLGSLLMGGGTLSYPAAGAELRGTVVEDSFYSPAIGGRLRFAVYLPAGYADQTSRYPVVYFLHGLPATGNAYRDVAFVAHALEEVHRLAIVVGPQGARSSDTDPEYLDWGPGRNWETALAAELPRVVDARYRTIADRSGRAVLGVSAGGYGAALIGLRHLDSFSVIESWSGYFHPTDPSGAHPMTRGSDVDDALANLHTYVPVLRDEFTRLPTFLGFYVGDHDPTFRQENILLARELRRAGVPFTFELYPGAHERSLWEGQAQLWLSLAVDRLAAAQ